MTQSHLSVLSFLLKVLFLIKVFNLPVAHQAKLRLNVGVLLMTNSTFPVDLRRVGPAIDMGVEEVRGRYDIEFNTVVANYSVWCERARYIAPGYLMDMYFYQNITAFIGPACSYAVETSARVAEYLRVPLVTGLGDLVIRKPEQEDMFQTTAILSYNIRKLSGKIFIYFLFICLFIYLCIYLSIQTYLICLRLTLTKAFFGL